MFTPIAQDLVYTSEHGDAGQSSTRTTATLYAMRGVLLRQRYYIDETTLLSVVASDVVVYTVAPVGDMTQIDV